MSTPSPTNIIADNLLSDEEHQSLDVETVKQVMPVQHLIRHGPFLELVIQSVVEKAPPNAQLCALSSNELQRILDDERVSKIVEKGVQNKTFRNVRNLVALRTLHVPGPDVGTSTAARDDDKGRKATMLSWESPFIGKAHEAFYETMSDVCRGSVPKMYARSLAVVQSSGMGKSRMIDELSKEHFVIPINLRTTGTGFPPGDKVVSTFLRRDPFCAEEATHRAQAFLISLFETTAKTIPDLDWIIPADPPTSKAQKFRLYMTDGQDYSQPGFWRKAFYTKVIVRATEILNLQVQKPKTSSVNPQGQGLGLGLGFEASSVDAEITKSKDIIPMDTNDERKSGMDTAEDQKIESDASPIINFMEKGKLLSLYDSALNLVEVLNTPLTTDSLKSNPPLIILAYDEAHGLIFPKNEDNPRAPTAYSQHRRAIRGLRTLPIFALFLSTTGKVHDLTPPPEFDSSDRLRDLTLHLLPPFSTLGFDQMVETHAPKGGQNFGINDVSKVGFMVLFGRPLWGSRYENGSPVDRGEIVEFATQKLMQGDLDKPSPSAKLALMSVRLALEFNAQTTEGRVREMEQVEKYMRVCILVHKGFETAVTISPSEPLLAEAARQYMTEPGSKFNMPASLIEHLTTMGLDKGDRGELAAQVILILAADKACKEHLATACEQRSTPPTLEITSTIPRAFSVELFIKALLKEHDDVLGSFPAKWRMETESDLTFQTAFKDTRIYFTHFIKLDHRKVVNREFLWMLAIRGCVALCADGQGGIDIIAPLVFGTETLCRSNISALFVQVKNDKNYRARPKTILFDLMNPFLVNFFDRHEEKPLPIIRMVFALGSPTAAVKVIPQYEERPPRKTKTAQKAVQTSPRYTSYDIWCAKASSETFGVIKIEDEQNYSLLLKTEKVFPQAYRSESAQEEIDSIRRSMNPATSVEGAHWGKWAPFCGANTLPKGDLGDDVDFAEEE